MDAVYDSEIAFVFSTPEDLQNQLRFQKLSLNGQLIMPEPSILDENLERCYTSRLVRFADSSLLCAWSDPLEGGWFPDVYLRHIAPSGEPLDNGPILLCGERYHQEYPQIAVNGNQALIAWADSRSGILNSEDTISGIWAEAFSSDFLPADDPVVPAMPGAVLHANYPNPFNPSTTISFDLPAAGIASLSIYNLRGQLVKTLLDRSQQASGRHFLNWDGNDALGRKVSSGVYLYRLTFDGQIQTRRMLMMK
jgi:hypothetical protein